ncbi:hypothetical protein ES703_54304 [subsurface metagenome]
MDSPQPLLFVGKKANHLFSAVEYVEEMKQNRITIFWGGQPFVSFLEKDDREIRNTVAVALANAEIRKNDISTVFGINPRQLSRYINGHTSLQEGPGRPLLVTEQIASFVQQEYCLICAEGSRKWRTCVADAVSEKFHVNLKPSTLSAIVANLFKDSSSLSHPKPARKMSQEATTDRETEGGVSESIGLPDGMSTHPATSTGDENACLEEEDVTAGVLKSKNDVITMPYEAPADPVKLAEVQQVPGPICSQGNFHHNSEESLERRLRKGIYSRYAGGLLLNPFLARILQHVVKEERYAYSATQISLESYLLTFLQMNTFGSNNYESIQELHPDEFGPIVGLYRSPSLPTLYRITPEFLSPVDAIEFSCLIARNFLQNLAIGCQLFYVDGHFQRYWDKIKMLRGFHAQTYQNQKGYFQYILSTHDGSPVLLLDSDAMVNFQDSISLLVAKLLSVMPSGTVPRVVFDRGGYDRILMARFGGENAQKDQLAADYISWDMHDDTDYSKFELEWQDIILQLKGNDPDHPRELELKVAETPRDVQRGIWHENSPIKDHRKLILRQDYQRKGVLRSICTPFCTSDHASSAPELVSQLTFRWRQENVFKIVDDDYGFDAISTYKTQSYTPEIIEEFPPVLQQILAFRTFDNPLRRREKTKCKEVEYLLGRISDRLGRLQRGEKLRADRSKYCLPKEKAALESLYDEKLAELHRLEAVRLMLPAKVNRLDYLCENEYRRLDFSKKWILDILRAAAYNARRMALNSWMSVYSDWRDYTQRFRDLLNVGGTLQLKGKTLYVELKPMHQSRYQKAAELFVQKIKDLSPMTFGIGPYPIRFSFKTGQIYRIK